MANSPNWRSELFSAEETDLLVCEGKACRLSTSLRVYTCCVPAYVDASYYLNMHPSNIRKILRRWPDFCWSMAQSLSAAQCTWPHLILRPACPWAHRWAQIHLLLKKHGHWVWKWQLAITVGLRSAMLCAGCKKGHLVLVCLPNPS